MIETHPFGNFVPKNAKYLLIGSFPGVISETYDFYYSNSRNQFWPILEKVYEIDLKTKSQKVKLLQNIKMAMTDIILSCERKSGTNLDANLTNITYNTEGIRNLINNNEIKIIYLTSRFVEAKFNKILRDIEVTKITLPSPSSRYARLSISQKIKIYKKMLPKIT